MIEKNAFSIIFGIFMLITCRDVFYGHNGHETEPNSPKPTTPSEHAHPYLKPNHQQDDPTLTPGGPPQPNIASITGIPTIRIQYCHSCGYRQAFDGISKMLQTQFPEIKVIGEVHQPGWLRSQIVNLLFITKLAVIAMIYMDINPFIYLQMETPRIWSYMSQNKVTSTLFILFIGNTIDGNMMSTGAFEVFYNDMPIWSKLQTGRMPDLPELFQIVQYQTSLGRKTKVGEFMATG